MIGPGPRARLGLHPTRNRVVPLGGEDRQQHREGVNAMNTNAEQRAAQLEHLYSVLAEMLPKVRPYIAMNADLRKVVKAFEAVGKPTPEEISAALGFSRGGASS